MLSPCVEPLHYHPPPAHPRARSCIDQKFGVQSMMVQTAGSSVVEGSLTGLKNADDFRLRVFAARDALLLNAPNAAFGSLSADKAPSAAQSMGGSGGSPELAQLKEINAGIKQVSCLAFVGQYFQLFCC